VVTRTRLKVGLYPISVSNMEMVTGVMEGNDKKSLYNHVTVLHRNRITFNNQPDAVIIQSYSIIKLYMFRPSSLPIIRSFLLYIRHW